MQIIVLATTNNHKVEEYNQILKGKVKVISFKDLNIDLPEVEENGKTFSDNALIKALAASKYTNLPVIADDSGLCIESLAGFPGIESARFAKKCSGFANANQVLVDKVPKDNRTAHFSCAIALVNYLDKPVVVEAQTYGKIVKKYNNELSFGYDPIFIPDGYNKTYHQLDKDIKNQISHRAKACEKLLEILTRKK